MCRNHSHAVANEILATRLETGLTVHIAGLEHDEFTLETIQTGAKLTVPRCKMLLLLSMAPDTPCFSLTALMEVLSVLSSVWVAEEESSIVTTWPPSSANLVS